MDKIKNKLNFGLIGVGKTLYNSSCAYYDGTDLEVLVTERYNKKKYSGEWPWRVLEFFNKYKKSSKITESRDVITSKRFEYALDKYSPFFKFIESKKLSHFISNEEVTSLSHHYAHALCGLTFTDVDHAVICVIDGAGTNSENFSELTHLESENEFIPKEKAYEGMSFYLYENEKLICLNKRFYRFYNLNNSHEKVVSSSPGMLFEYISEVIFGSKHDAGKVMGLSAFGISKKYNTIEDLLESVEWEKKFTTSSKEDWESSIHMDYYKNLAASSQKLFEAILTSEIEKYSKYSENLIIVGGAAMNCVNNMNLTNKTSFKKVIVPPCPGDDGLSIGLLQYSFFLEKKKYFKNLSPYLGRNTSYTNKENVLNTFKKYKIKLLGEDIVDYTASLLADGKVIGWFQGRSEIGARALGNRSIIARVDRVDLKNYLNGKIKFRESFRPYACSCLEEYSDKYFDITKDFKSPYMSFTVPIKKEWKSKFREVLHIDGTSRAQFVSSDLNSKYHKLISAVGDKTGIYSVLNTSLNVMGQPIVETLDDLLLFFETSNVDGLAIGDYFVTK